jgi:hypothetical protein
MVEHAKVSSNYVIPFCETDFTINYYVAWGFKKESEDVQAKVNMKIN